MPFLNSINGTLAFTAVVGLKACFPSFGVVMRCWFNAAWMRSRRMSGRNAVLGFSLIRKPTCWAKVRLSSHVCLLRKTLDGPWGICCLASLLLVVPRESKLWYGSPKLCGFYRSCSNKLSCSSRLASKNGSVVLEYYRSGIFSFLCCRTLWGHLLFCSLYRIVLLWILLVWSI